MEFLSLQKAVREAKAVRVVNQKEIKAIKLEGLKETRIIAQLKVKVEAKVAMTQAAEEVVVKAVAKKANLVTVKVEAREVKIKNSGCYRPPLAAGRGILTYL